MYALEDRRTVASSANGDEGRFLEWFKPCCNYCITRIWTRPGCNATKPNPAYLKWNHVKNNFQKHGGHHMGNQGDCCVSAASNKAPHHCAVLHCLVLAGH